MAKTFRLILKDSENRGVSLNIKTLKDFNIENLKAAVNLYSQILKKEEAEAKRLAAEASKRFTIIDKKTKKPIEPLQIFLNKDEAKNYFVARSLEKSKLEIKEIKTE